MKIYNNQRERLYSMRGGDDYLDDLLEKAFSDGYYYAQKEFIGADDIKRFKNLHGGEITNEEAYKRLKRIEEPVVGKTRMADKSYYRGKSLHKYAGGWDGNIIRSGSIENRSSDINRQFNQRISKQNKAYKQDLIRSKIRIGLREHPTNQGIQKTTKQKTNKVLTFVKNLIKK